MAADAPLACVLAAGAATRFGGGKLDAACAGRRVGDFALDAVTRAGLHPGVIVVGAEVPRFAQEASGWQLLINPRADAGLGTSVALAAQRAMGERQGLLVLLADMPLVEPDLLRDLLAGAGPAATAHAARAGVPAFVPYPLLGPLAQLEGEAGAGAILSAMDGLRLVAAAPGSLADVDRAEDLQAVEEALARRSA